MNIRTATTGELADRLKKIRREIVRSGGDPRDVVDIEVASLLDELNSRGTIASREAVDLWMSPPRRRRAKTRRHGRY